MTRKPKPIKPFKTLDEEADFWDTHDLSKLMDNPNTPLSDLPLLEFVKEDVMTVRIQKSIKEKLKQTARKLGINTSTLARMWIMEKLQSSHI